MAILRKVDDGFMRIWDPLGESQCWFYNELDQMNWTYDGFMGI